MNNKLCYYANENDKHLSAERDDARHNERNGGGEPTRTGNRGDIWHYIGVLLSFCRNCIPRAYGTCRRRARCNVRQQAGWRIPLGGRGVWRTCGVSGNMVAVDTIDDMVSYGADIWRGEHSFYRYEPYGR